MKFSSMEIRLNFFTYFSLNTEDYLNIEKLTSNKQNYLEIVKLPRDSKLI